MTTYEKLKQLLNDANLLQTLADHINCDKVRLNLYEEDNQCYLLELRVIQIIDDREVLIYIESFAIQLTDRGSLLFFDIRFGEFVSPSQALETAKTGLIIENRLKSFL